MGLVCRETEVIQGDQDLIAISLFIHGFICLKHTINK